MKLYKLSSIFKQLKHLLLQSGDPLVGKTFPHRQIAPSPPLLVNPSKQLNVRFVPCTTGSACTVTK